LLRKAGSSVANKGVIFLSVQDEAHGWVVAGRYLVLAVVVKVDVHLAGVGVAEGTNFEVDQYMAFQNAVVENEVDEVVLVVEGDALLAGLEAKAPA